MAEPVVQLTIDIAAPAEVVFDMLADPAQHPKIDGSTTVRRLLRGPRRLSAGSRFRVGMRLFGVPYRVTNRVVEFEPNRLIAWRHFEPQRWRYELEPIAGGTRVRESFDYSFYPLAGQWLIRLTGWPERNRRAIAQTLPRLRAAAEDRARGEETVMPSAPDPRPAVLDRAAVSREMEQARLDFHRLIAGAAPADLRRASDGTRWTNQQLLFHMLFGYLIVRALLILIRIFRVLPDGASKAFARLLDSAHRPFDLINYLGSCAGARIIPPRRMTQVLDHVITALQLHLQGETSSALRCGMHYPATWDPFFADYMTLADIYRYPTQHFRFHQRQLTLSPPDA